MWRYIRPDNLILNATTDYDRSNVLADVLNDVLFKNATFSSLGSPGPRRPALLINATQLGLSEARLFTFTGSNFISYVDSDLGKYPIADAVVASAAFPGVFSAVTLKSYVTGPPRATPLPQSYVHLIDGGPSDNLGVDTLLSAARAYRGTSKQSNFQCFIFAVDAYPPGADPSMLFRRDLRASAIDYIVDTNFLDAFDALLARRRESTLRDLGFRLEVRGAADNPLGDPAWPRSTVSLRETFYAGEEGLSRLVHPYDRVLKVPLGRSPEAAAMENASCLVWHIAMSEVASVKYSPQDIPPQDGPIGEARHPVLVFRQRLWHITSRISTDFNLAGPKKCEPTVLQSALRDTARILIQEDDISRRAACSWFTAAFSGQHFSCDTQRNPLLQRDLPLQIVGRRPNVEISCTR
ncbi:MAG: patatin-like phospholipase family protein [Verrucomicrobiales bacterium]|nr:patatin-like phospholipase family protein [Verrucomicrobiales bacterium]